MNRWAWTLLLALAWAAGCGDDSSGDKSDADATTPDGGAPAIGPDDAGTDASDLVWTPLDAGTSSTGETPPATGAVDDPLAGRECAQVRRPLPMALTPRCSGVTRACIASCDTEADPDACRDACLEADDMPPDSATGLDCPGCVYLNLFACIDAADCHEGVAQFFCCLEDRCTGPGVPADCGSGLCGNELMTAATCGYFANESCLDYLGPEVGVCFAEADNDGGI